METMWKGIQFFKATFTVFAIVAVQNVHNQNPTECIGKFILQETISIFEYSMTYFSVYNILAYLNGTYRNSPFAGVLKVKNGTRLNFVYRETESDCNNSHIGWHVGYTHISAHRNKTKALYNFSDSVHQESDGACLHEFNMTVILNFASSGMPQSNIIYFEKSPNSYVTYKICSRNLTANYIMVILENENSEQPTCKCTNWIQ